MKTLADLLPTIEAYARDRCAAFDENHDFEHHIRFVARDAERIARGEGADPILCVVAALFHELGLAEGREGHEERGAKMAEQYLREVGCSAETAAAVAAAIRDNEHERIAGGSLEAKCLYDADTLQTLGPYGFTRVFSDMTSVLEHQPRHAAMALLPTYQERQFDRLQTETGRRLARDGHRLMREFYEYYRNMEQR